MHVKFEPISCSCESTIHSSPLCISGGCCCCLAGRLQVQPALAVFFIYFFIFVFYKNIFSCSKFIGIYPGRPVAWRPGPGRRAAGAFLQKFSMRICAEAPRGPVARQRSGRPRPPGSGATASQRPLALVCFTKNSEKKTLDLS